ncbi:hypothetical protein HYU14_04690 [Candidatus Woesearchaeota archaeon]|nr:hypothetical protein [Candidatus Woesearchaeota archaeon]
MITFSQRHIGYGLVGFALLLFILLSMVKLDVDKQEEFICKAVDESPTLKMEDCPVHNSNTSWWIISAYALNFVILGIGGFLIVLPRFQQGKPQQVSFKTIDVSELDDEEKKVYHLIREKKGSVYQSELVKETGFSKVKVTRVLDKLAAKQVIDRQRRGMTNIVVLK